jgi:hypothetical protein
MLDAGLTAVNSNDVGPKLRIGMVVATSEVLPGVLHALS